MERIEIEVMAEEGRNVVTPWVPTRVMRFEKSLRTSTRVCRVVTDKGKAYMKAMGNPVGEHALACELVGTRLASWFGLPTFDWKVIDLDDKVEIPFHGGGNATPGPAFLTRAQNGFPWGGTSKELKALINPQDIPRLVVFDNWTLNCDRHPPDTENRKPNPDNVFLTSDGVPKKHLKLVAMDHSHCFTCARDLSARIDRIDQVKDRRVYGLFPEFKELVKENVVKEAIGKMAEFTPHLAAQFASEIPGAWAVSREGRESLARFLVDRRDFLADKILDLLAADCWPQAEMDLDGGENNG